MSSQLKHSWPVVPLASSQTNPLGNRSVLLWLSVRVLFLRVGDPANRTRGTIYCTVQYSYYCTIQYNTVQYCTIQYNIVQYLLYNTVRHCIAKYSLLICNFIIATVLYIIVIYDNVLYYIYVVL